VRSRAIRSARPKSVNTSSVGIAAPWFVVAVQAMEALSVSTSVGTDDPSPPPAASMKYVAVPLVRHRRGLEGGVIVDGGPPRWAPCSLVPAPCFELMPAICGAVVRAGSTHERPVNPAVQQRIWRRIAPSAPAIRRLCSATDSVRLSMVQSPLTPRPLIARRWIVDVMRSPLVAK
jgi:hypothetical protein